MATISTSYSGGGSPSYSNSSSISGGMPTLLQSPQSYYSMLMAQLDQALGENTYNWALGEFNNTNQISNGFINNLTQQANVANGLASGFANEYAAIGQPSLEALYNMAGQYSSNGRIAANEGAAISGAEQAGNQSWQNTVQQLEQEGIDPSAGKYAELEAANKAQTAASAAGASQQARLATTATGQQLLGETVAAGEQLPGYAANEANIGAGLTEAGANVNLAQGHLGATLMDAANPYLSSASGALKLPGSGNITHSLSTSQSTGATPNSTQSSSNSGGGGGGGGSYNSGYSGLLGSSGGGYPGAGVGSGIDSGGGGGGDTGSFGGAGGAGMAQGGEVGAPQGVIPDDATSGGFVPRHASPSMGAQTDDIPARLNAEEFVMPRDVAKWKGEEFFQKLIAQSRKARMQAAAQAAPTPGPPMQPHEQPRFISHNLGGPI